MDNNDDDDDRQQQQLLLDGDRCDDDDSWTTAVDDLQRDPEQPAVVRAKAPGGGGDESSIVTAAAARTMRTQRSYLVPPGDDGSSSGSDDRPPPPLLLLPRALHRRIVRSYLDRNSVNSYVLTCKYVKDKVVGGRRRGRDRDGDDADAMPWTSACPFRRRGHRQRQRERGRSIGGGRAFDDDGGGADAAEESSGDAATTSSTPASAPSAVPEDAVTPDGVVFSRDMSRVVMYTEDYYDNGNDEYYPGVVEVWDKFSGLVRVIEGDVDVSVTGGSYLKPAISPDNQLLVFRGSEGGGIKIVHVPSSGITSGYQDTTTMVTSVAFLDNFTVAVTKEWYNGVEIHAINRNDGNRILCSSLETILADLTLGVEGYNYPPNHNGENPYRQGKVASSFFSCSAGADSTSDSNRNHNRASSSLIAFVRCVDDRDVILHDLIRNVSTARAIPDGCSKINDVAFSPNADALVVAHEEGGMSVLGCNGGNVEDLGQLRRLNIGNGRRQYSYDTISFVPASSPSSGGGGGGVGNKIIVARYANSTRLRVIDIHNEVILCDGWNSSQWGMLVY